MDSKLMWKLTAGKQADAFLCANDDPFHPDQLLHRSVNFSLHFAIRSGIPRVPDQQCGK